MPSDPDSTNQRPYSVSELAFALKRTIEETFGFVRLRAEISKVTFHGNGHVYLDLKDEKSSISGVVWKGSVRGLAIRPQSGLEVIVTGRITTYPGRSQYQIIIESMEPAGIGALLAQLERLKARLASEGLFDAERKRPLPLTPRTIGVITSPTGAVIRDILHRVSARWPCRVVVWPVLVQGDAAAGQVRAAIDGFAALGADGIIPKPDVLIVARGGGSVEDLWPFNDEALARAAAACPIPLISAVGHETDTTLIDFVSDRRAPTPTAAAEMATPVRADLLAGLAEREQRLIRAQTGRLDRARARLESAANRLPRLPDLLALSTQRLDGTAQRLGSALSANVSAHRQALTETAGSLRPPLLTGMIRAREQQLLSTTARLKPALERRMERAAERLAHLDQLRRSFDPDRPLAQGFARIERGDGRLARSASTLAAGETVSLIFQDGRRQAVIDAPSTAQPPASTRRRKTGDTGQGLLFEAPDPG